MVQYPVGIAASGHNIVEGSDAFAILSVKVNDFVAQHLKVHSQVTANESTTTRDEYAHLFLALAHWIGIDNDVVHTGRLGGVQVLAFQLERFSRLCERFHCQFPSAQIHLLDMCRWCLSFTQRSQ